MTALAWIKRFEQRVQFRNERPRIRLSARSRAMLAPLSKQHRRLIRLVRTPHKKFFYVVGNGSAIASFTCRAPEKRFNAISDGGSSDTSPC